MAEKETLNEAMKIKVINNGPYALGWRLTDDEVAALDRASAKI